MWGDVAHRTDSCLKPRSCALRFFRTSARRGEVGCHPEETLRPNALGEHGSATSNLDSNLPGGRDGGRDDGCVRERPDDPLTSDARGSPRQSPSRKERDETVATREGSQRGSAHAHVCDG